MSLTTNDPGWDEFGGTTMTTWIKDAIWFVRNNLERVFRVTIGISLLCSFVACGVTFSANYPTTHDIPIHTEYSPADGTDILEYNGAHRGDMSQEAGRFGVWEDDVFYPFARLPAVDPNDIIECWVTHYGPPRFTADDTTARNITIAECLKLVRQKEIAWNIDIDGFCAVHRALPWYDNVRDEIPVLIEVEGHGRYLVLDRKGPRDAVGVDIYLPEQDGYEFCERNVCVWEIEQ